MRLVPVDSHVKFEKVKQIGKKPAGGASAQPQIDLQAALVRHGAATAPPKKENILGKLRNNIRRSIALTNRTINTVGGSSATIKTGVVATSTSKGRDSKSSAGKEEGSKTTPKAPKKKKAGKKRKSESDDGDDGDKECDFDDNFSGDEGLNSGDDNRHNSSDIGLSDDDDAEKDVYAAQLLDEE